MSEFADKSLRQDEGVGRSSDDQDSQTDAFRSLDLLADNDNLPDTDWLSDKGKGASQTQADQDGGIWENIRSFINTRSDQEDKLKQACEQQEAQLEMHKGCSGMVTIPVHFVTTRPPKFDKDFNIVGFESGKGNREYAGVVNVTIPALDQSTKEQQTCRKQMGWIYDRSVCTDKPHVDSPSKIWSDQNEMYDDIDKGNRKGPLAYYIPGFNTPFRTAALMAAVTERDWGVPVVLDSWPCQDKFGVSAYKKDEKNIEAHYHEVTKPLVQEGIDRRGANNVYAIGFSMGTRPVTELAIDQKQLYAKSHNENDLLGYVAEAEADQDEEWFKKNVEDDDAASGSIPQIRNITNEYTAMMSGIAGGSKEIALYMSEPGQNSDLALWASKEIHHGRMPLGLAGKEIFRGLSQPPSNVHAVVVNEINTGPFYHEDHDLVMANYKRTHTPGPGMCLRDESGNLGAGHYLRLRVGKECAERKSSSAAPDAAPQNKYSDIYSKGLDPYSLDSL